MTCGIYKITNKINDKCYIGQSFNIEERWKQHITTERKRYPNKLLYKAFNKYGVNNFDFQIIEECSEESLNTKEQYWIQYYHSCIYDEKGYGYNCTFGGDGNRTGGGENSPGNILTQSEVDIIQQMLINNYESKNIFNKFPKLTYGMLSAINQGHSWHNKTLSYPLKPLSDNCIFSQKQVNEIRNKYKTCLYSQKELAKEYKCGIETIRSIINNKTYIDKNYNPPKKRKPPVDIRIFSTEEVIAYRTEFFNKNISVMGLWKKSKHSYVSYACFYNMLHGITYNDIPLPQKKEE